MVHHLIYIGVIALLIAVICFQQIRRKRERELARAEHDTVVGEEKRLFHFLHGLGESLQVDSTPPNMHRYIVTGVAEVVDADGGILYLLENRERPELVPVYQTDVAAPVIPLAADILEIQGLRQQRRLRSFLQLTAVPRGAGLVGKALDGRETVYAESLVEHPHFDGAANPLQENLAALLAPLVYGQKEIGVLAVVRSGRRGFTTNDRDVFTSVAEQSSFALGSALIHAEANEKRRLDQELRNASEIQRVLLPDKPPGLGDYRFASAFKPARLVSGDYFDYVRVDDRHHGVAIGDVCGKGIAASLIMAMCRSILRNNAAGNPSPAAVLHAVNRAIFPDIREDKFISLLYAVLGRDNGEITLARAGHEPPLCYRKATGEVEEIDCPGLAAGIDDGEVFERLVTDHSIHVSPGDVLLLYTDGITEAADTQENEFGLQRIKETLAASAPGGAQAVATALVAAIERFAGTAPQSDDITLIAIEKR